MEGVLTTSVDDILDNPEIDIVIELIGGYEPARAFILKALNNGKHVVTAIRHYWLNMAMSFLAWLKRKDSLLDSKRRLVELFPLFGLSARHLWLIGFNRLRELLMAPRIIFSVKCRMKIVILILL